MIECRTLTADNAEEIAQWCNGRVVTEYDALDHSVSSPGINLLCGEEVERASVGDVIIEKNGTFHVSHKI
jgi:hypothetical protein